ncbi:MAG: glycosyltransferase family 4 protein [Bifidobacteriaceae bacterium]|nr:glycosyltransferase family 4 protein [Bifidobacteriaceae bacterium]
MSKVWLPGRLLNRHVGGNTTYARALASSLAEEGVAVGRLPAGRTRAGTAWAETRAGLARRGPGEVLHYTSDTGPLLRPAAAAVVTVHGVASRWVRVARTPAQEAVWRGRVRRAVATCDELITDSQSSAADVVAVFGADLAAIHVIPLGVDHGLYRPGPVDQDALARLGAPRGEYLLYVGNIEPRKNLVELVAAVSDPRLPPLVVAGRPAWNAAPSMEAILGSGRVTYVGFVSEADKVALTRGAAALVFPSLYEGFGLPVLEALACGTPVVCSDRGSLAEVAGPAWRLDGVDRAAIRDGLERALADSAWLAHVRSDGPAWAAGFSWRETTRAHLRVYEDALAVREWRTD